MIRIILFVAAISFLVALSVHWVTGKHKQVIKAQCNDLTLSNTTSRSGACSHHGGVLRWIE